MTEQPQTPDADEIDLDSLPDPDDTPDYDAGVHQMPQGEVHPDDEGPALADHEVGQVLASPVVDDGRGYTPEGDA